jgi:HEAT repeat protein
MEFSPLFVRHFARLVWLLIHEPGGIDEQKAALRALVALSKFGAIRMGAREWQLLANDEPLEGSHEGATELTTQMAAHGIREVRFAVAPPAAPVLGVARLLAGTPAKVDPGRAALEQLAAMRTDAVSLVLENAIVPEPVKAPEVEPSRADAGIQVTHDISADAEIEAQLRAAIEGNGALSHGPVKEELPPPAPVTDAPTVQSPAAEPAAEPPIERQARPEPSSSSSASIRRSHSDPISAPRVGPSDGIVRDEGGGMWMHFAAVQPPSGTAEELFAKLDRFHSVDAISRVLDELVVVAENAAREGKPILVGDVFHGIVRRETAAIDAAKRAYAMAIRRMARPALLRAVAHLLPRKLERHAEYFQVLVRTGEDGADALIDQLTQAQKAEDRRTYFDALLRLQAGVPALVHMLGDARWFVARNAAELLGEMKAAEAEEPLKQLLRHQDERVRRAATNALMSLDSITARKAVHDALQDPSPDVRMQAAMALGARTDGRSAGTLTQALDGEVDSEVQLAIIAALGKVATNEAVDRLIRAAEPEARAFFRKKPTPLRVAAVQALGEARTPAALAALARMKNDKEREVRDAVARMLGRAVAK